MTVWRESWSMAAFASKGGPRNISEATMFSSAAREMKKPSLIALERVGPQPFMFAFNFPHEITLDNCREEINEILERSDLKDEHKAAILGDNARRFYQI